MSDVLWRGIIALLTSALTIGRLSGSPINGADGTVASSSIRRRVRYYRLQCLQAIGQCCRPRLQDQWRFDLVECALLHRRDAIEAWSLGELFWTKFLAAPGPDNDFRLIADDFLRGHDAVLGSLARCAVGKDIDAAGRVDQF